MLAGSALISAGEGLKADSGQPPRALILGGGLAGLAAALQLKDQGFHLTVVEATDRLGGRATSFADGRTGQTIDRCQHVLLGCCTQLVDFYDRLAVLEFIDWHQTLYFADGRGKIRELRAHPWWPAPFHLLPSFLGWGAFSLREKVALARGFRAVMGVRDRGDFAGMTFGEFLALHHQPADLVARFWKVIIVSACNLAVERVSATMGLQVLQEGFLNHRDAYRIGISSRPLRELYEPMREVIDDVRFGARVVGVERSRTTGLPKVSLADGSELSDFAVLICALPMEGVAKVFSEELQVLDERSFRFPGVLETSPILSVHLFFDIAISDLPFVAFLDRSIHWVFFKDGGRYAHVVVSAAGGWLELSEGEIVKRVRADLAGVFASAGGEHLRAARVIKERRATLAVTPRSMSLRPSTWTSVPGVFLAGDYVETGWPATMEGAVRSGNAAARAAVEFAVDTGIVDQTVEIPRVADLQKSLLYRLIAAMPLI